MHTKIEEKKVLMKVRSLLEKSGELTSGSLVLPTEEIIKLIKPDKQTIDLKDYVDEIPVKTGGGNFILPKSSGETMRSVEELKESPNLFALEFFNVSFEVVTYRGKFPVSYEMMDDLLGVAEKAMLANSELQALNTRNKKIIEGMKTFTAKTVSTIDELKTLINKDLGSKYNTKLFLSESAFDYLDHLKDESGRYILRENTNTESGYSVLRREVVVFGDDVIGTAEGDKVGFIGDAEAAIAFFNRKEIELSWGTPSVAGDFILTTTRFDVQPVDIEAGYFVTFTPEI